jgi:signal transduction histidine kinase
MGRANSDVRDREASRPAGPARLRAPGHAGHTVQFYEDEAFLCGAVTDYLAAGLAAGEPLLVVATAPRRHAFSQQLTSRGFDVEDAHRSGLLTWLDARETLATFMVDSRPDRRRFNTALGGAVARSLRGGRHAAVRAYGEMVDLLCQDGNTDGAIRLEELWNGLAATHGFTLLCAYAMSNFHKEEHALQFQEICRHHSHVVPTERYTQVDADARLVEISRLQQRAQTLEAEVEQRRELERRLREALAEREQVLERERAARAEAEAASRAKGEFLAVMSHELRTPLNAIGGHVQLIELGIHGPVTDAQRDALVRVQRSQRHLLSLINDVLNLVRVERGCLDYGQEQLPLAPLLADVTAMVEPLLSAKQLACEITTSPPSADGAGSELPAARADREKVQQVLLNLLTNASKFTPEGGRVTLEAGPCPGAPEAVFVRVRDTGIGIPAAKLESVFEPFVQLAARPFDRPGGIGLGLGLAISRDLARGMGGDLTAASTIGEGTTFTLTLPRA